MTTKFSVAIVGNGAAGYFAAAAIKRNFPDISVAVYYDPKKTHIGVGESIGFHARIFFKDILGFQDDRYWVQQSHSNYKLGLKKTGWDGTDIPWYIGAVGPQRLFDMFSEPSQSLSFSDMWLQLYSRGLRTKQDMPWDYPHGVFYLEDLDPNNNTSYTYHINAEHIKEVVHNLVGKPAGVVDVPIPVKTITLTQDQEIDCLILDDDSVVKADLYLDCTGFQKTLVQHLPFRFQSSGEYNNTAIVGPYKYQDPNEHVNWTIHDAMDYGWRFSITLQERSGEGYVFNRDIMPDRQKIVEEWERRTGKKNVISREITWDPGYHEQAFVGNCIVLGLGFGFIDPFDANGFTGTLKSIYKMVEFLRRDPNRTLWWQQEFNEFVHATTQDVRLRIDSAFHLAPKNNTEYWRWMKQLAIKHHTFDRARQACLDSRARQSMTKHNSQWLYVYKLIAYYGLDIDIPKVHIDQSVIAKKLAVIKQLNSQHKEKNLQNIDRVVRVSRTKFMRV